MSDRPAPEVGGEPAAPSLVGGRYALEVEIGRGGMGRVYRAIDRRLGRPVALKLLGRAHEPAAVERFRREVQAVSGLQHPNVVAVFDAGEEEGEPYLVEELLTGRTLRQVLATGPPPLREAIDLALQVARGLQAAHARGIVHRDLKPDNLFLTDEGLVKVVDFGLAKLLPGGEAAGTPTEHAGGGASGSSSGPLTRTGQILGTMGYMAPEQVRGVEVDARADSFAFGAVLYELLSGRRAFKGGTPFETGYAILQQEPPPLPRQVPAALRALVQGCLRKAPEERPGTAALVAALEVMLFATPPQPTPLDTLPLGSSWTPRRGRAVAATALVIAASAFGLLAWRWLHRERPFAVAPGPAAAPGSAPGGPSAAPAAGGTTVAVLPFSTEGEARGAYLGEGLVQLVSAGLGQRGLRTVDPEALLHYASHEAGPVDAARAGQIARHFGAGAWVLGSASQRGSALTLEARIFRAGEARPAGEARATGEVDGLYRLATELASALAAQLGSGALAEAPPPGAGPEPRAFTASADALRAFLRGEAELRRDGWSTAIKQFEEAVRLDPDFALAQYRLAMAASLEAPGVAADALGRAMRAAERLSSRERELVEALASFLAGRWADAERRYRGLIAARPDDVEAWFQLGEALYHFNPLHGRPAGEATEAFQRVLLLDPRHGAALGHLVDLAQLAGERPMVAALADQFLALDAREEGLALPMRWARAAARGDLEQREALRALLPDPQRASWLDAWRTTVRAFWQPDDLADAAWAAALTTGRGDGVQRAEGLWLQAMLELAHGRRRAARERLEAAAAQRPSEVYRFWLVWTSTLSFLPVEAGELRRDLEAARALEPGPSALLRAGKPFLEGALALRLGDGRGVVAATRTLARLREPELGSAPQDLARALRARQEQARGRPAAARAALEEMELEVPYRSHHRYTRLYEPLLRLQLAPATPAGEAESARIAASWAFFDAQEPLWFAPVALQRARQLDARGERAAAVRLYRRFLDLRAEPDPELLPEVEKVRARLRALEAAARR